jgi:hypothetical protein
MPTPFTHLARAQQLLDEHSLPRPAEDLLRQHWAAFLLGSIAPDAHHMVDAFNVNRVTTHFFDYGPQVEPPAEAVLLGNYPELQFDQLGTGAHAAFVAGYLGHLAMDEVWAVEVVHRFAIGRWDDRRRRHFAFTTLIALMDQRDYALLPNDYHAILSGAEPNGWLPFLPDYALVAWRDRIVTQLVPTGIPETLPILARTIYSGYDDLVDMLNQPQRMQDELWAHFPQAEAEGKEAAAYAHMQRVIIDYLRN